MSLKTRVSDGLSFLTNHLFIATTGAAALIHSTWSLAVFFGGQEPKQGSQDWWGWIIPGLLLAISIDIGQIATSAQIAKGERTPAKYATFALLAVATYFLQWLYLAHHIPLITLGPGVNQNVVPFATGVRDIALWFLPALLPISTLLYTFSYGKVAKQRKEMMTIKQTTQTEVRVERPTAIHLQSVDAPQIAAASQDAKDRYEVRCDDCDWMGSYTAPRGATNALVAHRRHAHPQREFSSNGHKE